MSFQHFEFEFEFDRPRPRPSRDAAPSFLFVLYKMSLTLLLLSSCQLSNNLTTRFGPLRERSHLFKVRTYSLSQPGSLHDLLSCLSSDKKSFLKTFKISYWLLIYYIYMILEIFSNLVNQQIIYPDISIILSILNLRYYNFIFTLLLKGFIQNFFIMLQYTH